MPDSETPGNAYPVDPRDPGEPGEPSDGERSATAATADPSRTSEPFEDQQRLDGNAAGGVLGAIFPFDMTMALATCAGCGASKPLGAVMAYMHGMGTILRCPTCDTALIRVAHLRSNYYLDLRGVRVVQIAAEEVSGVTTR